MGAAEGRCDRAQSGCETGDMSSLVPPSVTTAGTPAMIRGSYATGRATKADIVDKAFHVFAESGYEGTSLREISRRCGISHATLLHHFPTKWRLLLGVLELRDELQHIEPATLEETLSLLLGIAVRNEETPGLVRTFTLLAAEAADTSHPAHGYFARRSSALRHQISDGIEQAQARGELDPGIDAWGSATRLVATWEGLQLMAPLSGEPLSIAENLATVFEELVGHPITPAFLEPRDAVPDASRDADE